MNEHTCTDIRQGSCLPSPPSALNQGPPNAGYQTAEWAGYNHAHHELAMTHYPHTRNYLRFPFHSPLILGGDSYVCEGILRNLSLRGCSILSDRELPLGSIVRISVLIPDQVRAVPIEKGRVIWARNHESGVEFVELSLHTRLCLNRILRTTLIEFLNARQSRTRQNPVVENLSHPVHTQ